MEAERIWPSGTIRFDRGDAEDGSPLVVMLCTNRITGRPAEIAYAVADFIALAEGMGTLAEAIRTDAAGGV